MRKNGIAINNAKGIHKHEKAETVRGEQRLSHVLYSFYDSFLQRHYLLS